MIAPGELLLGKYRIQERLGEGGMGTVWRARDELLDRDVAIKELRADLAGHEALAERFRAEAVALARLAHPGIAALHGLERDADRFYMVMEYVPGATLEAIVQREGPLPWDRAASLCALVCDGLGHAHQQGVVHRDVKPANVMLTPSDAVKVMDFGIARMAGQSRQTRHGSTIGTPHYMAPEQLRGEEVDGRADVYALGAVLFELISGRVPFDADSDYKLMMMQLHDAPPRASGAVAGVPSAIDRIIARAMAKDPADRFQTAGAFRDALMEAVRSAPATGTHRASLLAGVLDRLRVTSAAGDPPLHRDWRTWVTGVMVVAAGVLVLGGGDGGGQDAPPPPPPASQESATVPPPVSYPRIDGASDRPTGPSVNPVPPPASRERATPPPPPPASTPRQRATPGGGSAVTPPPPPPPPPPPAAAAVDHSAAIAEAVRGWLGGLSRRQADGISGSVDGKALADLVREGRASVEGIGTPRISVDGARATASVTATVAVRSSFGAARKHPATFQVSLRESGGGWTVTSGRVQ